MITQSLIRKVILNELNIVEYHDKRGTILFSKILNGNLIRLISSSHQRNERMGNFTYQDAVDQYDDFLVRNKSKYSKIRIGVPNNIIKDIFSENLDKIITTFDYINPPNNKIVFVKLRKDNQDDPFFDYAEFILHKEGSNYKIITSAFSENGNYLKNFRSDSQEPRLTLEQNKLFKLSVIYL